MRLFFILAALLITSSAAGQERARGRVLLDSAGIQKGIAQVQIYIPATKSITYTDSDGFFTFDTPIEGHMEIIARFSASDSSVFMYHPPHVVFPVLIKTWIEFKEIQIRAEKSASTISGRGIQKIEILNEGEFKKAACCILGESFETTNSVEVNNSDGVSGIRHVEMLGLAGKYVLMSRNTMPLLRGFALLNGLNQVPGPMVAGVNIAKGAGSVVSGFEGITGGIDYALKAEDTDPRLFVNAFANSQQRYEGNVVWKQNINRHIYNHTYLHYGQQQHFTDKGKDQITDMPKYNRIFVGDQLRFSAKKMEGMLGGIYVNEQRQGGDVHGFHSQLPQNYFRFDHKEEKTELWAKLGIFLNEDASKSIGNIFTATQNNSSATLNNINNRNWKGQQQSLSYTGMYGSPEEELWSIRTGVHVNYDKVSETFTDSNLIKFSPKREEFSAGVFGELVYKTEKFMAVMGGRIDHNNLYGNYFTPRLHIKYSKNNSQSLHLQAGVGRRTSWIFIENLPLLISNRNLNVLGDGSKKAYGLDQEKAFNGGISYVKNGVVFNQNSTFTVDAFYTYFFNQVIADRDANAKEIIIRNESGNQTWMAQAEWMLKPHRRLDIKLSYRFVYSQMFLAGQNRLQTMQSPHRILNVINYQTRKKWFFDLITQVNSSKRLPITSANPEAFQMPEYSPWYTIVNALVRKDIKNFELYAGSENIFNVLQKNPVLGGNNASSPYFDAAYAWGPTMGRNVYVGFRWKMK